MKRFGATLLFFLSYLPCYAQQSCPLQPTLIKNVGSQISVSLQNMSAKQVTNYHIGITFQDVNGGIHVFPQHFSDNVTLGSHSHRTAIWHSPQAINFLFPLAKIYLLDATFTDGTQWIDDGTESCSVASVQE